MGSKIQENRLSQGARADDDILTKTKKIFNSHHRRLNKKFILHEKLEPNSFFSICIKNDSNFEQIIKIIDA